MVGYKITDALSFGPRVEILYRGERYDIGTGSDLKFNSTNYGVGLFSRLKIFNQYFIHTEFQTLSNEIGYDIDYVNNEVLTARSWDDHFYIGGGYGASGGGIGFQVSILWDVLQEFTSSNLPIQYRMGINYKF